MVDSLIRCMFDTTVFNRIVDGVIQSQSLPEGVIAFAAHVQRDEINKTPNAERRAALERVFVGLSKAVPTSSFVLDASRLDEAKLMQ
jgi:hypothetical protein